MEVFNLIMNELYSVGRSSNLDFKDITILMHPLFRHQLLCSFGRSGGYRMCDDLYQKDTLNGCRVIVTNQVDSYQILTNPRASRPICVQWPSFMDNKADHIVDSMQYAVRLEPQSNKQHTLDEVEW